MKCNGSLEALTQHESSPPLVGGEVGADVGAEAGFTIPLPAPPPPLVGGDVGAEAGFTGSAESVGARVGSGVGAHVAQRGHVGAAVGVTLGAVTSTYTVLGYDHDVGWPLAAALPEGIATVHIIL